MSVVHQDVELAESLERGVTDLLGRTGGSKVDVQELAGAGQFLFEGLALLLVDVDEQDLRAFTGEDSGDSATDSTGAAGDDRYLAVQPHETLLFVSAAQTVAVSSTASAIFSRPAML